jgi:hypothetical protein
MKIDIILGRIGKLLLTVLTVMAYWGVIELWKALFNMPVSWATGGALIVLVILCLLSIPFLFILTLIWLVGLVS